MPKMIGHYFPVHYWYELPTIQQAHEAFKVIQQERAKALLPTMIDYWQEIILERLPFLDVFIEGESNLNIVNSRLALNTDLFNNNTVEARNIYDSVKLINRSVGVSIAIYPSQIIDNGFIPDITRNRAYGLTIFRNGTIRTRIHLELDGEAPNPEYLAIGATLLEIQLEVYLTHINYKWEAALTEHFLWEFPTHRWNERALFEKHPEIHHTKVFSNDGQAWNPSEVIDR